MAIGSTVWIAGRGGVAPPAALGASPVWVAPNDGTVPSATQVKVVGHGGTPVAGATPVWIAAYGGPPPAAIGAVPVCISGYGSSSGGGATSVWSASDAATNGMTLSNGGLTVMYPGAANWVSVRGTTSHNSGKVYVEFLYGGGAVQTYFASVGVASSGFDASGQIGTSNYSGGYQMINAPLVSAGFTNVSVPSLNYTTIGDVIGIAVDFTAQKIWFSINNAWNTSLLRPGPKDPGTGTFNNLTFVAATVGSLFPTMSFHGTNSTGGGTWTLQTTPASQKYLPPPGFQAWDGGPVTVQPWTPAQLPGLNFWFDAQDASSITKTGSNVTQWNDKSGHGYNMGQATVANQPTFNATGLNGKPALHFDGVSAIKFLATLVPTPANLFPSGHAIYFVTNQTIGGIQNDCEPFYAGGPYPDPFSRRDTTVMIGDGDAGNYVPQVATFNVAIGSPAYWGWRYDYVTDWWDDWLNGANVTSVKFNRAGYASTTTNYYIGTRGGNFDLSVTGFVGEIIVCTSLLEADRVKLETYLKAKWGL